MCLYDYFKSALVNVFIQDSLEDLARAFRFKNCLKSSVVTDEECGSWFNEPDVVCVCLLTHPWRCVWQIGKLICGKIRLEHPSMMRKCSHRRGISVTWPLCTEQYLCCRNNFLLHILSLAAHCLISFGYKRLCLYAQSSLSVGHIEIKVF